MKFGLNDTDFSECLELFQFLDTNNDGQIDLEELFEAESSIGLQLSELEIEVLTQKFGKLTGVSLNFEEFVEFYKDCVLTHEVSKNEALQMFQNSDLNKDGYLDINDLKYMLISQGEVVSQEEIHTILRDYDKNRDGRLNLEEFLESIY